MTTTDPSGGATERSISLAYDLNHRPEKVWRALTEPELLAKWLLPLIANQNGAPSLAPKVKFAFQAPPQPGWDGVIRCEVIEIDPPQRLSYRWDVGELDTVVTFTLAPTEGGSHLSILQSGFRPDQTEALGGATYGWKMMIDKLADLLTDEENRPKEIKNQKMNEIKKRHPEADSYLNNLDRWRAEMVRLREIVLESPLSEDWKWKQPCYTFNKANVVILSDFKAYASLNFFKGSLIKDPLGLLVAPGENSQSSRQLRFTSVAEIDEKEEAIRDYIHAAIEIEKAGLKVEYKPKSDYPVPAELLAEFDEAPDFKAAFEALTPGRQKGYLLHFGGAKQSKSRTARIEKYRERIFDGKGMQDCVCGLSKKLPRCDGSHKALQS